MGSFTRLFGSLLLQRLAQPLTIGSAKCPSIKIRDTRMIRLMEVLLYGASVVSGWTTRQIQKAILISFAIGADCYELNQLRYDLRKLKVHGFRHRLTSRGKPVLRLDEPKEFARHADMAATSNLYGRLSLRVKCKA